MRGQILPILLAAGCARGDLTLTPSQIDWGEVDFHADRPADGYQATQIIVQNNGGAPVDLVLSGLDTEHLVLSAFLAEEDPPTLPTLEPGQQTLLTIGVWAYVPGERESRVEGAFTLSADRLRQPVDVPWSFIPVRNIPTDTGP